MICPVCKSAMIAVEFNQIELDYCTSCKGVWFDNVELELLFQKLNLEHENILLSQVLKLGEIRTRHKKRRCPICRKNMKLINLGDSSEIIIDVCSRGDGLWFDGGELNLLLKEQSVKLGRTAGTQHILGFLSEVFKA